MKILECSSAGDKRFSAFYAHTTFFGWSNSIENIYQSVKRDEYGLKPGKGKKVHHIEIKGKELPTRYLTPLYKLLWIKYLDNNKELVEYAKGFDAFTDKFRGRAINCQADVIGEYVKNGRESLMNDFEIKELIRVIKNIK